MAPSATVCPAAFDHNWITNWSIDTKLKVRVVHEVFDDLVQYQRHCQLNRYSILPTTMEDRLVLCPLCVEMRVLFQIGTSLQILVGQTWRKHQSMYH